jgi:hypothetical protein
MIVANPEIIDLSLVTTYDVSFEGLTTTVFIKGTNASVNVIGTTGTPLEYAQVTFLYGANATGGSVQIFGVAMPTQLLNTPHVIQCNYFESNWYVSFNANIGSAGLITNNNIASNAAIALDKLAALTASRAIATTVGGQLTASPTTTTDLAKLSAISVSASQINNVGATTAVTADLNILAGSALAGLTPTELSYLIGVTSSLQSQLNAKANTADFSGLIELKSFEVTIPSAQVLTLNTAPITLVPAQGANKIIVPVSIAGQMVYGTTPYATNGNLQILNGGTDEIALVNASGFLFGTTSRTVNISMLNATLATDTQYVGNAALTVTVNGGNPTAGDSDITIRCLYYVITL